jgi:hypothetical protein
MRCLFCSQPGFTTMTVGPDPIGPMCLTHADEFMARLAVRMNQPDGYHKWRQHNGLPPKDLPHG